MKLSPPGVRRTLVCLSLAAAWPLAHAKADLTLLDLEQLMEMKVVGASKYEQTQSEVAAAVSILTRAEIRAFGWRTLDEALASLPGVHTTYDHQYTYVGARGFGLPGDYITRVLVTINGNRINDAVYDSGNTGRRFPLDLDLVERIEFIPGPGGAVYGQNAMLGVVNVITRDGASLHGTELAAHVERPQSLREGRASWGKRFDSGLDVLLSVSGLRARGEDRFFEYGASGVSGVARGMDGSRDNELFARAARGPWSLELIDGAYRKDDPTGAFLSDPLVRGQYQSDRYTLAQGQYQDSFAGSTLHLQGRLFGGQERYDSRFSYGTPFRFPATSSWYGSDLRLLYTGIAAHKLMLGVEAQDNNRAEQRLIDSANPANDLLIRSPSARTGLYVQDEWRLASTLTATLGLRVDHNSFTGSKTSPRLALIWQAGPATTLKALYGRAHRAPNAYERDYTDGFAQVANPRLGGESIDTVELVADQRVGSDLRLRASAYQWTMRDLITLGTDPATGIAQYQSGGNVQAKGLELSADKTWRSGARLRASVSLQNVQDAGGTRLPNAPQLLGKLNYSGLLPVGGLRLGYELQYGSSRRTLDGGQTGGYALSSLYLSTDRLGRNLEVGLRVRNLLGKRYAQPAADNNWQNALAQDGRSVRLEVRYRF